MKEEVTKTIFANRTEYRNSKGQLHREDGPAIEYNGGNKVWYKNDQINREDGPAAEWVEGTKCWYRDSKRHREDGPAVECANGNKFWYKNGKLHREDGPAVEYADGRKEWWVNGVQPATLKQVTKKVKIEHCSQERIRRKIELD
jgi:hypothetical protein